MTDWNYLDYTPANLVSNGEVRHSGLLNKATVLLNDAARTT